MESPYSKWNKKQWNLIIIIIMIRCGEWNLYNYHYYSATNTPAIKPKLKKKQLKMKKNSKFFITTIPFHPLSYASLHYIPILYQTYLTNHRDSHHTSYIHLVVLLLPHYKFDVGIVCVSTVLLIVFENEKKTDPTDRPSKNQ